MRPEQRAMNNATYRECFEVCDEVKEARAGKKIRLRDYPAAIVMCADSWDNPTASAIARSGGQRDECKNYIGACAEPHSARTVMRARQGTKVDELAFSYAYRPRTKTVIRYCRNCTDVFNVENP